tara:strand:- start:189 stop:779 length:591 start_codon:yes stop_codon:yes gene_type:complete
MGGPVAEDSGRDNRAAVAQVQSRQRTAEANRLPGLLGGLMGGLGDMNRRNIIRGLELGGEAVRDERGQVVGVINLNKMGARVYSGRPGYDPNAPKPERRSDEQPSTASPAAAPSLPPASPPTSSPGGGAPGSSGQAAPAADPIRPASVVRSAGETAAVTRGRASPYMRGRRTRSILTSSRGVLGDAPTEKKQLLGS